MPVDGFFIPSNAYLFPGLKTPVEVNMERILRFVCEYYRVTVEDLKSKSRLQSLCTPRHIAMYLAITMCRASTVFAGGFFNRDHATACHAVKSVTNCIETNLKFATLIHELEDKIKHDN